MQKVILGAIVSLFGFVNPVLAQSVIVPDGTLGNERSVVGPEVIKGLPSDRIDGGATRGINLFHSFEQFSIGVGRGSYFTNLTGVENILSRVTGNGRSDIQGKLGVLGNANLFLLNPNGIVFGPNSSLDVNGSFTATTANAIQLGDRGIFSASNPTPVSSLLTIDPSAFLFNQIKVAPIQSRSQNLFIEDGQSLVFLGGDLILDKSSLGVATVMGGRAELGGLAAPGKVDLEIDGGIFRLGFPNDILRSDVTFKNESTVNVVAGGGGSLAVHARNLIVSNGSSLLAGIGTGLGSSNVQAGDITLNVTESIIVTGKGSYISNDISSNALGSGGNVNIFTKRLSIKDGADITSDNYGIGQGGSTTIRASELVEVIGVAPSDFLDLSRLSADVAGGENSRGGNLAIYTNQLIVRDGGQVSTSAISDGGIAGNLNVYATQLVELSGTSPGSEVKNVYPSGLFSIINFDSKGQGGNISLETKLLSVSDGGKLQTTTLGSGNAGDLFILTDEIYVFESGRTHFYNTSINADVSLSPQTVIAPKGNGGNLSIETNQMRIYGGSVSADTYGDGNSGNLFIKAHDFIEIVGKVSETGRDSYVSSDVSQGAKGQGGNLVIETNRLSIKNGGLIAANTYGSGNAGSILLQAAESISMTNDGAISTATFGQGDSGRISVRSPNISLRDSSYITSRVGTGGIGNGGDIEIQAQTLTLETGSQISSFVARQQRNSDGTIIFGGQGDAGNLKITVTDLIRLSGVDSNGFSAGLVTTTERGAIGLAGDITVDTGNLKIEDGAVIAASTYNSNLGGSIRIATKNFALLNGGQIVSSTRSSGDAGSIQVAVEGNTVISGSYPNLKNRINLTTQYLQDPDIARQFPTVDDIILNEGSESGLLTITTANSSGNGGNIALSTESLNLNSKGLISTQSNGTGKAGNISIDVRSNFEATNGNILTSAQFSGGDVKIISKSIRLRENSDIQTNVVNGTGGSITLSADSIVALNDSDILAFARDGKGGNVTLNTRAFFGQNYRPAPPGTDPRTLDGNDRVDINASGTISGTISLPDVSFIQNSLNQLPKSAIDTEKLVSQTCIVRQNQPTGTFYILGKTNLPQRPGDLIPSNYSTQESPTQTANRPWQKGDPIVEPQGFYKLANGRLVMSRECDR